MKDRKYWEEHNARELKKFRPFVYIPVWMAELALTFGRNLDGCIIDWPVPLDIPSLSDLRDE